ARSASPPATARAPWSTSTPAPTSWCPWPPDRRPERASSMDWLQLDQRICVVTGGAKGLGAGIVQALLASGCRVAVLDHDSDALAQLATTHPDGQRLLPLHADVSSPAAVEAAFQTLQQHWGAGPSVLVN